MSACLANCLRGVFRSASIRLNAFSSCYRGFPCAVMMVKFFPVVLALQLFICPGLSHPATLTVDGAQKFQTIDGFGVNANSLSWKNGELKPAIDMLADQMGATLWRVVFDMEDWETTNDNSDPAVFNWDYYNGVYSGPKFQNLWGTIGYLNQKGISSGITLSLMGYVPDWMGGFKITPASEDEWVEMVVSLLLYARNTMGLTFSSFDPLNETDSGIFEGPYADAAQYARLLAKLSQRLNAVGLGDVKLVGPNTADIVTGVTSYMPAMMASGEVMSKVDHFGFHNYAGTADGAEQAIRSSAYPGKNFYMTEMTTIGDIMNVLDEGPSAVEVWDGYDSVYNHAIAKGYGSTPPNDAGNGPAPLSYDTTSGTYSPRKVFYLYEQLFRYVPAGSVRISAVQSAGNVIALAFYHESGNRLTIVGRNTGWNSVSYTGRLANLPTISSLQYYMTSETDPAANFVREADIAVLSGTFSFVAPPSGMFTLTGLTVGADQTPPTVSITAPANGATVGGMVTIMSSASDNVAVTGVRYFLDGVGLNGEISIAPDYSLPWDTTTTMNGVHRLSAVARDASGNTASSSPVDVTVANTDTVPPAVSISNPRQNETVAGTIDLVAAASDINGVAGVQFLLDNVPFRSEIPTPPYSVPLNTTTISDGLHTVAAQAQDAVGNMSTSSAVSFNVLNTPGVVFPIKFVQRSMSITSSGQSLSTTFPSPVTAGNFIAVSVSGWPNLPAATAVTDTLGNAYGVAGNVLVTQGAYSALYYAKNVAGGTDTVTVRTVASGGQISMVAAEFSGVDKVSPLDKVAGSTGSGTIPSSGNMTPAIPGELAIGSGTHNGNTVTSAVAGYSMIAIPTEDSVSHQPLAMEYQVLTGTQATAASFNLANGYPWTQNGALFKPAVQQVPDLTPPVASITSPAEGATVSAVITVSATASDNVAVTKVEFYVDNILKATDTTSPYQYVLDTSQLSNSPHAIRAVGYDGAGNSASATVNIIVDNEDNIAPTVAVTSPVANATVTGTVAVNAAASDNTGVVRVEFYLNDLLQAIDSTSPFGFSWNTSTFANGTHVLYARAYDAAGNAGKSADVAVTVSNDTIPPTVSVTSPAMNATVGGTVAVTASASDNIGVARVEFYVNGVLQVTDTTAPYAFSWNTAAVSNGTYSLMAKAYDGIGNSGASGSVTVVVSNAPAVIKLVQSASRTTSSAQNLAVTLPSNVTAGNFVVVSVSGWPNLPASTPVTDTLGNTYSIAGNVLTSQGAFSAIYYAKNAKAGRPAVTFRATRSGGQISMAVAEFSGVDTVSPLDRTAGTVGSGTSPSSGTMTPSQPGDLVIGSGTHNGNTTTSPGPGFTMIAVATEDSATHQPLAMEYQVLSGSQQAAASFNLVNGYSWTQNGALFKHK